MIINTTTIIKVTTFLILFFVSITIQGKGSQKIIKHKKEVTRKETSLIDRLLYKAKTYIGTPYRRSGKSPRGFDCSGFTSWIFKHHDVKLHCSSSGQYQQGRKVKKQNINPGDLVFFSGSRGGRHIGHVGIVYKVHSAGQFSFIHSSTHGGVKISSIDDRYYASRFKGARRVL